MLTRNTNAVDGQMTFRFSAMPHSGEKIIRLYSEAEIEESHAKERTRTGFGIDITGCRDFHEILDETGTNWRTHLEPVYLADGTEVPDNFAAIRDMDRRILSNRTLSHQYRPFQNEDFTDIGQGLMDAGAKPWRGGAYYGGRKVWYQFDLGDTEIMGDNHNRYLILSNTHDGSGSVMIAIVLVRIVCSNAMNFAMKNCSYKWAYVHKGQIGDKMAAAKAALLQSDQYLEEYKKEVDQLQKEPMSTAEINTTVELLMPFAKDASEASKERTQKQRDELLSIYYGKSDLSLLGDTKYHFMSAVSDYTSHPTTSRRKQTEEALERQQDRIMSGDPLLQKAYRLIAA